MNIFPNDALDNMLTHLTTSMLFTLEELVSDTLEAGFNVMKEDVYYSVKLSLKRFLRLLKNYYVLVVKVNSQSYRDKEQ